MVLVIEDEYPLQGIVEEALVDGGFGTDILSSGEEALTLFKGGLKDYKALVTDVNLKGRLSGWEVARQVREIDPGSRDLHDRCSSGRMGIARSPAQHPSAKAFRASAACHRSFAASERSAAALGSRVTPPQLASVVEVRGLPRSTSSTAAWGNTRMRGGDGARRHRFDGRGRQDAVEDGNQKPDRAVERALWHHRAILQGGQYSLSPAGEAAELLVEFAKDAGPSCPRWTSESSA